MAASLLVSLLVAAQAIATPPAAPLPQLSLAQATALRCGVAFALEDRARPGDTAIKSRHREFFVRTAAQIMHETGADRVAITALVTQEMTRLEGDAPARTAMMPGCLALLDASGI